MFVFLHPFRAAFSFTLDGQLKLDFAQVDNDPGKALALHGKLKDSVLKNVTTHLIRGDHVRVAEELNMSMLFPRVIPIWITPEGAPPHLMSDLRQFLTGLYKLRDSILFIEDCITKKTKCNTAQINTAVTVVKNFVMSISSDRIKMLGQLEKIEEGGQIEKMIQNFQQFLSSPSPSHENSWLTTLVDQEKNLCAKADEISKNIITYCFEPCINAVLNRYSGSKNVNVVLSILLEIPPLKIA